MNTDLRKTYLNPPESISRLMSFITAGSVGFLIDAVLLLLFTETLHWEPMPARFFSFWAAMSCTWSINRRYAFADLCAKEQSVFSEYMRYLFAQGLGALVNLGTFWVALHQVPGWERRPLYALVCGSALALVFNYLSLRHFVFGQEGSLDDTSSVTSFPRRLNREAMPRKHSLATSHDTKSNPHSGL